MEQVRMMNSKQVFAYSLYNCATVLDLECESSKMSDFDVM
jgi:hypothetical protein